MDKNMDNFSHKNIPTIGVVGLGYVGLPVAFHFSKKYSVIGYDVNKQRIEQLNKNFDWNKEISVEELESSSITFSSDASTLRKCNFIIIAVPTPVLEDRTPDLTFLEMASSIVGENLSKGTIVIYESTVFPGATEEVCIPKLEEASNLLVGKDFFVGYSPERINPGDTENTFNTISKIVSAQDLVTLEKIYNLYQSVINAPVYKAESIKVAEAAKVVENTQRDINIALMNELSYIFNKLGIDTLEVLQAAKTKWNFLHFAPGLVGGHCIGVDPYYLIHKAKEVGYFPKFISSAREVNDEMPSFIMNSLEKILEEKSIKKTESVITILGVTFKQNVPDIRNSKSIELIKMLQDKSYLLQVCDPHACPDKFFKETGVILTPIRELKKSDVVILSVPHKEFYNLSIKDYSSLLKNSTGIILDIKGVLHPLDVPTTIDLWRL